MPVRWLDDIGADDIGSVGGKAASLGELASAGLPVPPAFVVTADTYRGFIEEAGIDEALFEAVDVDTEDSAALAEAHERATELLLDTELPEPIREEVLAAYDELGDGEAFVAVRSSATAEDLPSIAADDTALIRVDGETVFGRMDEVAPLDCERHSVEVPAMTDDGVEWHEVGHLYEHTAKSERLYRVTTASGRQVTVSPDHSLIVLDEDRLEPKTARIDELDGGEKVPLVRELPAAGNGPREIDISEFVRGKDVAMTDGGLMIRSESNNWSIQNALPRTIRADEEFAYFLGLYVAEGSTYDDNVLSITNTDEEVLERALVFPKRLGLWNGQSKNKHSYRFYCKTLVRFLHAVAGAPSEERGKGRLAGNKRIPSFVFGWDEERVGAFLRGCFEGDGWASKAGVSYSTTSEHLLAGLVRLLELLGFDYLIRESEAEGEWSDSFEVRIPAREARRFKERIGFESERKRERLDDLVERRTEIDASPDFRSTITVTERLSDSIRDRYEDTIPVKEVEQALCPSCGDHIAKSSPYDGKDRWYCPDCGTAYYEDGVTFETVERQRRRNDRGQFEIGYKPWNKGRVVGTYGRRRFGRLMDDLGLDEFQFDDSLSWEAIERIEPVAYEGTVYDFCVPEAENFAAGRGSVITHNSASFAGQQETFLNVTRDGLVERVKECWASLFSQRAIYYRNEQGFDHGAVDIAVVVQEMVDAEKSGVMFTSHPSTGDPVMILEAAWGLGEAVVSGAVSPDNYVVDRRSGEVKEVTVAEKKVMVVRDGETGETVEQEVPEEDRNQRVLDEAEIVELVELGEEVEAHYGDPQDVEWAIADGEVFMLQSRPITTIAGGGIEDAATVEGAANGGEAVEEGAVLLRGLGASPGQASGSVRVVWNLDELAKVGAGDVIVTAMTTPDMVPAMKRAAGIVTDEGGMTSHAAIVSRELGVPAVVGCGNGTSVLADGQDVTIDGDKGTVVEGRTTASGREPVEEVRPKAPVKPMTATEVKVNVSIPEAAERAAATGADGVGLLRLEHLVLSTNQTPERYIEANGRKAYVDEIVAGVRTVADEFYPRPVRVRTLDAPTDEFRQLEGGDDEPREHNPMLGYRGIRRSLDRPEVFTCELEAFARLYEMGYDNVEVMLPLVNDADDVAAARALLEEAGIDVDRRAWGVMVETPASALGIDDIIDEGVDFASFGTNDLTQYTLAVDRNNETVADRFDELHPAVLSLIEGTIEACRARGVRTSICGQAGSKPAMVRFLVEAGISSISANIDAVRDVQHEVKRVEQRLILEAIRRDD